MSTMKIVALVFLAIIFVGAGLLTLPAASRSGISCGFRPALFTATSATCVTGLSLFDTWSQWSGFGQIVILCLIEIGGLGFMSAATLLVFAFRRRIGLKQRLVMAQALSVSDMDGIVKLQKTVLVGSFTVEAVGALILLLRFWPEYGFIRALKWGIFHSVSAFCNAGFDIFGCITPGASLLEFQSDPVVLLTLGGLVVIGGLGFLVWQEIAEERRFRKFSVYTKLVLLTTGALLLGGAILIALVEWNNPGTLGSLSTGEKLLNALFQSITLRTAGFASLDQAALTESGKGISMVLMLIGGSSGSTAGGLKTVSFVVLILFIVARSRGRNTVCVFKRTIPERQVLDAMTIAVIMLALILFGGIFISATSPIGLTDALYETVSAIATVGLTAGSTGSLSIPAQYLIILYMYFGRVGVLTISLGFLMGNRADERFHYADTNLLIG
ncbi:MAG: potassium uptake protein, TrkH family [Oscillospiraceae bacterium]|nr:potassium uptake protein, TrkH family [Oscillospiraceae bacterium]MBQ7130194.1 potassium uptake protein, TrkH family [Oscillospiraceae bacterium]